MNRLLKSAALPKVEVTKYVSFIFVLGVLVLAACGGSDPAPTPRPTLTPTAAPTPSATSTLTPGLTATPTQAIKQPGRTPSATPVPPTPDAPTAKATIEPAQAVMPGDLLWRYETGDRVQSSPAVADDAVYVGSDDGYVYAIKVSKPVKQ